MTPKSLCFNIHHYQAAVPEFPRHNERQLLTHNVCGIHDAIVTKVSPRCGEIRLTDPVVDYLAGRPCQHVDRVRPRLPFDDDS